MDRAPITMAGAQASFAERASTVDYMRHCLDRLARLDGEIRAFVTTDADQAMRLADESDRRHRAGRALSPIDGMPIAVKDIIETRDFPTQMGSALFEGWHSRRDAACVHAVRRAGAIVVGKTATTEFAVGRAAPTRNPHDLRRSPAGSSSGSAAAVAAGMVPFAFGTQTQSSTLRPASYCGVLGYKPTFGLFDMRGVHPLAQTHDHLGLLAGSLEDLWSVASVLTGWPERASADRRPVRLMLVRTAGWEAVDGAIKATFAAWLSTLEAAGIRIVSVAENDSLAKFEALLNDADEVSEDILACEMQWPFAGYAQAGKDQLGERVHALVERGATLAPARYAECVAYRDLLRQRAVQLAQECDAFVSLAASNVATLGLENTGARSLPIPWSLVGGPSMSLPLLESEGLPLGVQVMAAPGADRSLFETARWICHKGKSK